MFMIRISIFVTWVVFILTCGIAPAAPDEAPKEYAGPFAPKDALKTFRLPAGFRIELVAAEPDVLDPVAMSFDEDGRLYVVEMRDYPMGPPAPAGRVRLLEDSDGDGRMDRSTVFVDGLKYPVGVMAYNEGVLVTAAPDILFFKDTDADGKADVREVLYTGFKENNPQHRANGLTYGIDNWVYGAHAYGDIRPTLPKDAKPTKNARSDFRIRPRSRQFELVSGRSQFAMALDDWNNRFINNNFNHIYHPVLQRHYLKRNPHLAVSGLFDSLSDHGVPARVYPISKIQKRFNEFHHAGYTTTACGLVICRSGAFPKTYHGNSFCCEPLHNLIHRDVLTADGVSFVASRAPEEQDREFLTSTDNWFRPVNLVEGPDGAIYVADFYRPVIEHPFGIPVELQKGLDFRAGDDRGRIYRIIHDSSPAAPRPRLSKATSAQLVAHLERENSWWRVTAQRLLVRRQDLSAVEPLKRLALRSKLPQARLHALWTLDGLSALDSRLVTVALGDERAGIREHALRLAESRVGSSAPLAGAVLKQIEHENQRVRFQLSFTLGELLKLEGWHERALSVLVRLTVRDGGNNRFRTAVLSSVFGNEVELLARLYADFPAFLETPQRGAIAFVRMLADTVGNRGNEDEVVRLLRVVCADAADEPAAWQMATLSPLVSRLHRTGTPLETVTEKAKVSKVLATWGGRMMEVATASDRDATQRVEAIGLLALAPTPEIIPRLEELLRPQEPHAVQQAAVQALSAIPGERFKPLDKRIAAILLQGWSTYTAPVRDEILAALLSRPERVGHLLDAIEAGTVRAAELGPARRDQLLRFPAPGVRQRAEKLFDVQTPADRRKKIERMALQVQSLKGEVDTGRKIFLEKCANCHNRRTSTEGILHLSPKAIDVGPGLGNLRTRPKEVFLLDILDPNRNVDPRFVNYLVATSAGKLVTGMILSETATSLTLQNGKDVTTVTRGEIDEMKNTGLSLMPEGFEQGLTAQNLADLLEFLTHE